MKKALIPALLVVSAAFAPCLRKAVEFPVPASEVARTVGSPLFWHLWDGLLTHELARWTQTASRAGEESKWRPEWRNDALVCFFFQVSLKHAFDRSLSAAGENDALVVSIPQSVVRRIVEWRIHARS